ncbi:hypothetical protein RIF29_38815 [Crotalaria pallida]|uniref:VQ domain-containing protein n=1 Tax=Crotalaria pallida TaxID=3830 RepID=A0AAN9E5G1_CROPI
MSGVGGCSRTREPVKVVIINTQYVETDATSFKSVVQKLTGKDSDDTNNNNNNLASKAGKPHRQRVEEPTPTAVGGIGSSFLMRDVSFKEFDRFLSEMPPLNDIWAD